jgi:hypothetical protein
MVVRAGEGENHRTERGWAFFNVNGYLGTVTENGEVIAKAEQLRSP